LHAGTLAAAIETGCGRQPHPAAARSGNDEFATSV